MPASALSRLFTSRASLSSWECRGSVAGVAPGARVALWVIFGEGTKPWHYGPSSQFHVRRFLMPPSSHDGAFGLLLLTGG